MIDRRVRLGMLLVGAMLVAATPGAPAQLVAGPSEPALGGLPLWFETQGVGEPCYALIDPLELPDPTSPARFPDNVPEEFAYFDLRTPVTSVVGGGTVRFRETIQGFGLAPGFEPIVRNFVRIDLRGVLPGVYGVLTTPQGAIDGNVFEIAESRGRFEVMNLTGGATDMTAILEGPIRNLSIQTGEFVLARNGIVVASATADDFLGCAEDPPVLAPPLDAPPVAAFHVVCGFTLCAFDAATSFGSAERPIVAYEWELGDGNTSGGMRLVHAYALPGAYQVNLTVRDSSGNETLHSVLVNVFTADDPTIDPSILTSFDGVRTNNFLGVVVRSPFAIDRVDASVAGGPFVPMTLDEEGEWRAADVPPRNSLVRFAAHLSDGRTAMSPVFLWPSFAPG